MDFTLDFSSKMLKPILSIHLSKISGLTFVLFCHVMVGLVSFGESSPIFSKIIKCQISVRQDIDLTLNTRYQILCSCIEA